VRIGQIGDESMRQHCRTSPISEKTADDSQRAKSNHRWQMHALSVQSEASEPTNQWRHRLHLKKKKEKKKRNQFNRELVQNVDNEPTMRDFSCARSSDSFSQRNVVRMHSNTTRRQTIMQQSNITHYCTVPSLFFTCFVVVLIEQRPTKVEFGQDTARAP
jgi:hypothetical protein